MTRVRPAEASSSPFLARSTPVAAGQGGRGHCGVRPSGSSSLPWLHMACDRSTCRLEERERRGVRSAASAATRLPPANRPPSKIGAEGGLPWPRGGRLQRRAGCTRRARPRPAPGGWQCQEDATPQPRALLGPGGEPCGLPALRNLHVSLGITASPPKRDGKPPLPHPPASGLVPFNQNQAAHSAPHAPRFRTAWERTVRINPRLNSRRGVPAPWPLCERRDMHLFRGPDSADLEPEPMGISQTRPREAAAGLPAREHPLGPHHAGRAHKLAPATDASIEKAGVQLGRGGGNLGWACGGGAFTALHSHATQGRTSDLSGPQLPLPARL